MLKGVVDSVSDERLDCVVSCPPDVDIGDETLVSISEVLMGLVVDPASEVAPKLVCSLDAVDSEEDCD